MHTTNNIKSLPDDALLLGLKTLSETENETTVEVLLHLAELDKRKLYVPLGFSSLFSYCTGVLRYSEPAANRRICCARALGRFTELADLLLRKELSLSTLACAANILSPDNLETILAGIKGKSFRDVQDFVSKYRPRPVVREEIRPVAVVSKPDASSAREMPLFEKKKALGNSPIPLALEAAQPVPPACPPPQPVLEERYEVRFSIKKEVMKKLQEVKVLLSGKYPKGAKLEELLDEALEALLEKRSPERREKRREARRVVKVETSPTPQLGGKQPSRHIPLNLRDEVWRRDGGSCGFVGKDGKRCGERHDVEVHHVLPFAVWGSHEAGGLALRCRVHNAYEAVLDFGKERMSKFIKEPSTSEAGL